MEQDVSDVHTRASQIINQLDVERMNTPKRSNSDNYSCKPLPVKRKLFDEHLNQSTQEIVDDEIQDLIKDL